MRRQLRDRDEAANAASNDRMNLALAERIFGTARFR
jgi:hypothetical protein